ncbi:MAG TPA: hypothetical protein VIH36_08645 [Casimicrobiaceae bacterium]
MSERESSSVVADGDARRRSLLEKSLTTRFGLRLHMSLMLATAFAVGFASNFLMLRAGLSVLVLRWMLAYAAGYLVLFTAMRCWLAYVGIRPFVAASVGNALGDAANNAPIGWPTSGGGGGGGGGGGWHGGGGSFGGGGASGDFGGSPSGGVRLASTGSSGGHGGFGLGDLFDGDSAKLLILIAVIVAVLAAFGGGIVFMVVGAPHLLVDVAFGAAITSGVAPAARRVVSGASWEESVFAATWKPVTAMFAVLVVAGLVFHHYFPGMRTLGEAFASLR